MQRTSTPPCAACGAHTLLRKKDLYPITLAAALLDSTLRHLKARTVADLSQREEQTAPWSQLSVLNDVRPIVCRDIGQCQQQATDLATLIERNWLGDFDQLCLSCGIIELDQDDTEEAESCS